MQHLKSRSQFQAVLAGERLSSTAHFVLHRCSLQAVLPSAGPPAQVQTTAGTALPVLPQPAHGIACGALCGAMLPKRWARRAVTRNAIKRQIYAMCQQSAPSFVGSALVVRLKAGFDRMQFPSAVSPALRHVVRDELAQLFSHGASTLNQAAARASAQP